MPQFKVRELMINVLPESSQDQRIVCDFSFCDNLSRYCAITVPNCGSVSNINCRVSICPRVTLLEAVSCNDACCTLVDCSTGCTPACTIECTNQQCTGFLSCHPAVTTTQRADLQLEELTILKQQLRQALRVIEMQKQVLTESLRPQTLEQVQEIEEKLSGALEEMRMRRAELEQDSPKGQA